MPLLFTLSFAGTLAANVVAWAVIHAGAGLVVHRLPLRRLQQDGWLLRSRPWERGGHIYQRVLQVRRWKDRLPEAGALFAGGISKRHVAGDLDRFVAETRRAELGHWLAVAGSPAFALWNPPSGLALMTAYAVAVNAPFIVTQRYNRPRAQRVAARRQHR